MSRLGLALFDTTVQTTNEWLQDVEAAVGADRQVAYRALRAVLHALRDRLPVEEAAEPGDQLPGPGPRHLLRRLEASPPALGAGQPG